MLHPLERIVLRASRVLLGPGDVVLVGASGGPDSSALLAALAALAPRLGLGGLVAAHLDHGLRPDADRDRAAAEALAARLSVPFVCGRADARAEARARASGSLEAAARAVRYRFLLEQARLHGAARVAVAHTADDQAETVLLRVLRGTGLHGLRGIPRSRSLAGGVALVRPLLRASRADVLAYLAARDLPHATDPTNDDPRYLRNRLRHEVLPLLAARVNPRAPAALRRLAAQAARAAALLDREAATLLAAARRPGATGAGGWCVATLAAADPAVRGAALRLVAAAGAPDRASARHVRALERLLARGTGEAALPGGRVLRVEAGRLVEAPAADAAGPAAAAVGPVAPLPLPVPGSVVDAIAGLEVTARVLDRRAAPAQGDEAIGLAVLDADAVRGAIEVRRRRPGDRFWPLGAPGCRTVKRFLIDSRVPRAARAALPIVTLDDRPLWIVGHRIDERYKVTARTARVLELRARAVEAQQGSRT